MMMTGQSQKTAQVKNEEDGFVRMCLCAITVRVMFSSQCLQIKSSKEQA